MDHRDPGTGLADRISSSRWWCRIEGEVVLVKDVALRYWALLLVAVAWICCSKSALALECRPWST